MLKFHGKIDNKVSFKLAELNSLYHEKNKHNKQKTYTMEVATQDTNEVMLDSLENLEARIESIDKSDGLNQSVLDYIDSPDQWVLAGRLKDVVRSKFVQQLTAPNRASTLATFLLDVDLVKKLIGLGVKEVKEAVAISLEEFYKKNIEVFKGPIAEQLSEVTGELTRGAISVYEQNNSKTETELLTGIGPNQFYYDCCALPKINTPETLALSERTKKWDLNLKKNQLLKVCVRVCSQLKMKFHQKRKNNLQYLQSKKKSTKPVNLIWNNQITNLKNLMFPTTV